MPRLLAATQSKVPHYWSVEKAKLASQDTDSIRFQETWSSAKKMKSRHLNVRAGSHMRQLKTLVEVAISLDPQQREKNLITPFEGSSAQNLAR
jgi:hypothetical protein